ncbi:MAG: hypothetical protein ACR2HD_00350 [Solirubrobacteraceae bacterium]
MAGRSLKGQLKQAGRVGARYVAIVGETSSALRDMDTGDQTDVETETIVARILRERGLGA